MLGKRAAFSLMLAFGIGFGWQASDASAFRGTCCFTETCRCTADCPSAECHPYNCQESVCDAAIPVGHCYLCDN